MSGRSEEKKITHVVQTGGEVTINLVLTIKLEGDGLSVSTEASPITSKKLMKEYLSQGDDEDVDLIVPDIQPSGMIQFGEKLDVTNEE